MDTIIIQRHLNFWNYNGRNLTIPNACHTRSLNLNVPWKLPKSNCFKLNYDASWISATVYDGFGIILRDDVGNGKAPKTWVLIASSAEKAEAITLLQ